MMSTHAIACHYSAPRQSQRDGRGEKRRLLGARRKGGRDGDDASRQSMGKTRSGDSRCGERCLALTAGVEVLRYRLLDLIQSHNRIS